MHRLLWSSPLLLAFSSALAAEPTAPSTGPSNAPAPATAAAPAAPPAPAAKVTPLAHIETRGTGPVQMLLIPSAGCEWTVWDTFMTRNAEKYTMHAVTLPGFGGGPMPPAEPVDSVDEAPWIANAEAAILQLIEEKKIEKPVVMGHQLGGHIAIRLAANHGDTLRAAITIEGWPAYPLGDLGKEMTRQERLDIVTKQFEPWFREMTPQMWADQQRQMAGSFTHNPRRSAQIGEMMATQPKDALGRYILEYSAADITDLLPKISCPTVAIMCVPDDITDEVVRDALRTTQLDAFRNAVNTDVVYFEGPRTFVMDETPIPLDINVDAFLTGKPMPGVKMRPKPPANAAPGSTPASGGSAAPTPAAKP